MKRAATAMPWDDCKVAFGIDNDEPLDAIDALDGKLPRNWELKEINGTGAGWFAVFRVFGPVKTEDGRRVRRQLVKIGALER